MPAIKDPSKTLQFRDFSEGLVRTGSRAGIPDTALWEAQNVQVIGPGQIRTLVDPDTSIVTLDPPAVSLWGVIINLGGVETARLIAIRNDGSVTAIDPATGATTAIASAGAVSTAARVAMWRDTHVLFANPGLSSWDGTTFVTYPATFSGTTTSGLTTITWVSGTPASALITGMSVKGTGIPAGATVLSVVGTTITISASATASGTVTITVGTGCPTSGIRDVEVFEGHVWLVSGARSLVYSGPGSFTTFETVYAGGVATLTDSVFPGGITTIRTAVQLLWIVGPGAVNTLSNVQVVNGVTTFQVENLLAGIGTVFADSLQPFYRTMVFLANPGVHAILGATPQKLSDQLDGLFPQVVGFGTAPAAVFNLNNLTVYAVLVTVAGARRLLVYSRPTWAVCEQGDTLLWITRLIRPTTGAVECWGTDGAHVFQCFSGDTGSFRVRLKLFDFGEYTALKTVRRAAVEAEVDGAAPPDLHAYVENSKGQEQEIGTASLSEITWINAMGTPITWVNNVGDPITWIAQGRVLVKGFSEISGNLVSMRLQGTASAPLTIGAVAMEVGRAGEWTE